MKWKKINNSNNNNNVECDTQALFVHMFLLYREILVSS
jgi:hypothetical protein